MITQRRSHGQDLSQVILLREQDPYGPQQGEAQLTLSQTMQAHNIWQQKYSAVTETHFNNTSLSFKKKYHRMVLCDVQTIRGQCPPPKKN